MRYGYERVSTTKGTQKFDRQEDPLTKAGCEKIISERVSGTAASKPVLEELLGELKEGDQLVVVSIDRLGRSTQQVLNVIDELDLSDYEESHAFGEIYETILKELQSAGSAGEFYTPRAVTDFMAQVVKPQIGETMADKTTPRLIQFHTLKNAVNPPFLGGFLFSGTVAA